jgi:hypothetical protein
LSLADLRLDILRLDIGTLSLAFRGELTKFGDEGGDLLTGAPQREEGDVKGGERCEGGTLVRRRRGERRERKGRKERNGNMCREQRAYLLSLLSVNLLLKLVQRLLGLGGDRVSRVGSWASTFELARREATEQRPHRLSRRH